MLTSWNFKFAAGLFWNLWLAITTWRKDKSLQSFRGCFSSLSDYFTSLLVSNSWSINAACLVWFDLARPAWLREMLCHNWAAALGALGASAGSGSRCRCHGATFGWKVTWPDLTDGLFHLSHSFTFSISAQSRGSSGRSSEFDHSGLTPSLGEGGTLCPPPQPGKISLGAMKHTSRKQANNRVQ